VSNWQLIIGCIVGIISILGTVVTVTAVIIQMKSSITNLKDRDSERDKREEKERLEREKKESDVDRQVVDLLVMFKSFVSAQTELNVTVKGFMQAQTNINERMLTEVSQMTKATVEGSQVISLLTEVLKKRKELTSE
jgi:hypothetical protein